MRNEEARFTNTIEKNDQVNTITKITIAKILRQKRIRQFQDQARDQSGLRVAKGRVVKEKTMVHLMMLSITL